MKKQHVELIQTHTHKGVEYAPGAVLELRPDQAENLIALKRAKPAKADDAKSGGAAKKEV